MGVITKCKTANDVKNGSVVTMTDAGKFSTNFHETTEDVRNENLTNLANKWKDRFDDKTYYSS